MYTLTGLSHDEGSKVAYSAGVHQRGCDDAQPQARGACSSMLMPPPVYGADEGDLLVVGWGSTKGAIEEAVDRARAEGLRGVVAAPALPLAARARAAGDLRAGSAR